LIIHLLLTVNEEYRYSGTTRIENCDNRVIRTNQGVKRKMRMGRNGRKQKVEVVELKVIPFK
jgi:hypothetical protein